MKIILIIAIVLIVLVAILIILFKIIKGRAIAPNENGHILTYFSLSENSSNDMAEGRAIKSYRFLLNKNTLEIETPEIGEGVKIEIDKKQRECVEQRLLELIEKNSLRKWNGYDRWMDVLDDFHTFTLNIKYANKKEINAHGDHMFPNNYRQIFKEIQSIFSDYENIK